MDQRALVVIRC